MFTVLTTVLFNMWVNKHSGSDLHNFRIHDIITEISIYAFELPVNILMASWKLLCNMKSLRKSGSCSNV